MNQGNNKKAAAEGKYIYGIIRHHDPIDFGPIGMGQRSDKVYGICYKDISAIVSNTPVRIYEARRLNMITHEKVLEEIMKLFTVLPVRFSTIAEPDDDTGVIRIIEKYYDKFNEMLTSFEGRKEFGLKVMGREAAIYDRILGRYDEIRNLREELVSLPVDETHQERIKIGQMVVDAVKKERELFSESILEVLKPHAEKVKINDNYGEMMVLNAAFLVECSAEEAFDRTISELIEMHDKYLIFNYIKTSPIYNFVNLVINTKES